MSGLLICDSCGRAFSESDLLEDGPDANRIAIYNPAQIEPPDFDLVSPCCKSPDYSKAVFCRFCHEYKPDGDFDHDIDGMCKDCYARAIKGISHIIAAHGTIADNVVLANLMEE